MGALPVKHAHQTVTQQVQEAQCVSVTQGIAGQTQLTSPLAVMVSELHDPDNTLWIYVCRRCYHTES